MSDVICPHCNTRFDPNLAQRVTTYLIGRNPTRMAKDQIYDISTGQGIQDAFAQILERKGITVTLNFLPLSAVIEPRAEALNSNTPNIFLHPTAGSGVGFTQYAELVNGLSNSDVIRFARRIIKATSITKGFGTSSPQAGFLAMLSITSERARGWTAPFVMLVALGAAKKLISSGESIPSDHFIIATIAGASDGARAIRNFSTKITQCINGSGIGDPNGANDVLQRDQPEFYSCLEYYLCPKSKKEGQLPIEVFLDYIDYIQNKYAHLRET